MLTEERSKRHKMVSKSMYYTELSQEMADNCYVCFKNSLVATAKS